MMNKVEKILKEQRRMSDKVDRECKYCDIPSINLSKEELEQRKRKSMFSFTTFLIAFYTI